MNDSEIGEYVKYRLKKADETFEVAELLIENKKWNSAINRLYYAAYYAVSALLVQAGINTKTHSGVSEDSVFPKLYQIRNNRNGFGKSLL